VRDEQLVGIDTRRQATDDRMLHEHRRRVLAPGEEPELGIPDLREGRRQREAQAEGRDGSGGIRLGSFGHPRGSGSRAPLARVRFAMTEAVLPWLRLAARVASRRVRGGRGLCPGFLVFRLTSVRVFGKMTSMAFGSDRGSSDGFCDPVGDLRTAVDGLVDLDLLTMPDSEVGTDLLRWSRQRDREDAAFATRVLAAVRRGVGVSDGYVDTLGWLHWKTGKARAELRKMLRCAELCELLPVTGQAWRDGTISTTAVELITAARVKDCDEDLAAMEATFLDFARRGDHKRLQQVTQHFRACARADGSKPAPPDEFSVAFVGDRCVGRFDVANSAGQVIVDALEKFTRPPAVNDETSLAQRQAEGLVRMCEIALARGTDAPGALPVVSYITHARTPDDTTHPMTLGLYSGVIDPRERDRILCDAIVVPVTTNHRGEILALGRATAVWNRAQRRAITTRSPHCQWPGCEIPATWCDLHHVISWEEDGLTDEDNGTPLCRRHHTFVHQHRDWTYTFDHQQFRVFRADGTEVHPDAWHDLAV
jgi:hypothetical protein